MGWNTEAYVQVYCHGRISPDELRRAWIDIPEVVSAATVTGTADAILQVLAHDMRHLEDALERIRTSADIERSESIVVLSNLIDRSRARTPPRCIGSSTPTRGEQPLPPRSCMNSK